ncbi:bud emergence protein 1 [Serendipita sp. 407]|nr:bud emergence protein 1 [Serendipita sp. 407]
MKSLGIRRSAKETAPTNAAYSPQTLPTLSKPVSATVPPKKVIRALNSYRASAPQELSFTKGDFFYVIREVTHTNGNDYYEAHNPVTGSRGIVPREMFEGFDKANAAQRVVSTSGPGARISGPVSPPQAIRYSNNPSSPKATAVFYAVVQHDFQAERPDELDARAGDAISVVAHSNREWFVAKPIGKLGGPGLIPASFLEVRDPHTGQAIADLDELIDRGELPPVEEWKRATMSYKANSIALGVVDSPSGAPVLNSQFQKMALTSPGAENRYTYGAGSPQGGYLPPHEEHSPVIDQNHDASQLPVQDEALPIADITRLEVANPLPPGALIRAEVSSFHFEANDWVFRINATFKPDAPPTKNPFDPTPHMSRELTLFRVYDDFYVFQIHLLRTFPIEAGRDPDHPDDPPPEDEEGPGTRILPYMPGPQDDVDETVTDTRRHDLDIYLKELVALREVGAEHILRCELIRKFFAAKDGDIENEVPLPDGEDEYNGQGGNTYKNYYNQANGHGSPPADPRQTSEYNTSYHSHSQGNTYSHHATSTAETSQYPGQEPSHPYARAKPAVTQDRDSRASGDSGGYNRKSEAERSRGWNEPAHPYAREASGGSRGTEPSVSSPTSRYNNPPFGSPRRQNISPQQSPYTQSRESEYKGHNSTYSTATTTVGSSGNPNSPRISVSNPNAAFVKIKIFHSSTDELIAIRVSPRVSRRQLMEKIRERLGNNVENVKYRDGMATGSGGTGHFVDVADDGHLREWMSSGDKLVLYAE